MNYKHYLKLGLPVVGVLAAIIIVALIVGRPRFEPTVSKPNDLVINYNDLKVTKADLYEKMKTQYGLTSLLDTVDRALLAQYSDLVDEDAVEEKIEADKEKQGEDEFYTSFRKRGFITESETDLEEDIKDFYRLTFLKEVAAREAAKASLSEETVSTAVSEYREDVCVIPLEFTSKDDAETFLTSVSALSGQALIDAFETEWDGTKTEHDEETYLNSQLDCDYEYVRYDEVSGDYQALIFDDIAVGEYNDEYKAINITTNNKKYFVVYKVAEAAAKSTYDQAKFENELKERLADDIVDSAYIKENVLTLRKDAKLKIHDPELADLYEEGNEAFNGYTKHDNKSYVATFTTDSAQAVTTDEFYNNLKGRYAVDTIISLVDYEALLTIDAIQLTKAEKAERDEQVKTMKMNFVNSGYGQYFTWFEFMSLQYGVESEDQLKDFLIRSELVRRFVLGHEDYAGQSPVTDAEIQEYKNNWVNAKASHILFSLDRDGDGTVTDAEKIEAKRLADQVISGAPSHAEDAELNIFYEDAPFEGMNSVDLNDYETVFAAIAKEYSEDPGSGAQGGNVGWFGPAPIMSPEYSEQIEASQSKQPVPMVEEFTQAVIDTPVGQFADEPVLSEFGYHVILVTAKEEIPEKPADYETELENIEDHIDAKTRVDVVKYYGFMEQLKEQTEAKVYNQDLIEKELAQLRDETNFAFIDADIQAHYDVLQDVFLSYVPDADEATE